MIENQSGDMNFQRPSQVTEIEEIPNNSKMVKSLEVAESVLMAVMVLDFLGRIMNYMTVCKANQI